jgi:hypothetical protein
MLSHRDWGALANTSCIQEILLENEDIWLFYRHRRYGKPFGLWGYGGYPVESHRCLRLRKGDVVITMMKQN